MVHHWRSGGHASQWPSFHHREMQRYDQQRRHEDFTGRDGSNYQTDMFRIRKQTLSSSISDITAAHCNLKVQVVGIPDEFAGQVPIIVCDDGVQATAEIMRNAIVAEMGPKCSPVDIVKLQELGLADFPRTSSGKIQKS